MIVEIEAKFSCDDCGTEFIVGIDPAYVSSDGESIFDAAEESIRAGSSYRDGTDVSGGSGTVGADGRHYCNACSNGRARPTRTPEQLDQLADLIRRT